MNFTTKTINKLDYNDLDKEITAFLKSKNYSEKNFDKYDYECVAENEWGNYQSHSFDVEPEDPDQDEKQDIKGLGTGEILNWMCFDKIIPPGEYLVDVFW